jgi:hypothetical protein
MTTSQLVFCVTCYDAAVCAGCDAMSIACEYGHLLTVIMLGCRTHGPTAVDEVGVRVCWARRG